MENFEQEPSDTINQTQRKAEEASTRWPSILKEVVDKLTGKNMQVTYDFDNLEIEVPKVTGPGGKEMGSAKWRIDGKLKLSTEILKRESIE